MFWFPHSIKLLQEDHELSANTDNSIIEPRHDKTNKMSVRPAKTQISLNIRPVWSESSLSAWRKLGFLATHWVQSEDWSDWADAQADLSLRRAHSLLVLSCCGLYLFPQKYPMAVVGTAARGLIIYQLENQPQEFRKFESPLKYQVSLSLVKLMKWPVGPAKTEHLPNLGVSTLAVHLKKVLVLTAKPNQTERMLRLIWVLAECTGYLCCAPTWVLSCCLNNSHFNAYLDMMESSHYFQMLICPLYSLVSASLLKLCSLNNIWLWALKFSVEFVCVREFKPYEIRFSCRFWKIIGGQVRGFYLYFSFLDNQWQDDICIVENRNYWISNEPHHDKTCFCHMQTTKAQISLRIRAVWWVTLLFTAWIIQYL